MTDTTRQMGQSAPSAEDLRQRVRRDAMSWATSLHAEQSTMRGPEHVPEAILAAAKLYAEFVMPGSTT